MRRFVRGSVAVLALMAAACSSPPAPSAAALELEPWLITSDDVGPDFTQTYRGPVGVSGGRPCPDHDYAVPDHGALRSALTHGLATNHVDLTEMLWVTEPGEAGAVVAGLAAAYAACDRREWRDDGDDKAFAVVDAPDLGDAAVAGRTVVGDHPESGWQELTVTIQRGDVIADFTLTHEAGATPDASISESDFFSIIANAVEELPG